MPIDSRPSIFSAFYSQNPWRYAGYVFTIVICVAAVPAYANHPITADGWATRWWSWAHWWAARRAFIESDSLTASGLQASPKTIKELLEATHDPAKAVAGSAALALGRMKVSKTTDRLITLTHDKRLQVRRAAWMALGLIGDTKARQYIQSMLGRAQK